ncbi:hypothetical protein FB567DRAFT_130888 [Paraphoma chrysanthemicola]|uniref:Uncharacterized protein n=1 Tax=Paraphoma chrysanthemicola TaxID=798071 RepID=A0A8K0R0G7_9PLEO|nr:hypothetical protein FB567DRAFT_130888 [Paraphoma chrysanthemicola]
MGDKNDLTARENEVLALAWQCFESEPKVDMHKLASLTGYTPGSAAFTMGKIKRKLKNKTVGISASNPTPKKSTGRPRTKSAPAFKKPNSHASAADDDADDDEDEVDESPTKRAKKSSTKKRSTDSDDDEEFAVPKIKKEEVADMQSSANDFWDRLNGSIAQGEYAFEGLDQINGDQ